MSFAVINPPDYSVLARALLPFAKQQSAITFCDDDLLILELIARAIAIFERFSESALNPASYQWNVSASDFANGYAKVPLSPIGRWQAMKGADDVTTGYALELQGVSGILIYRLRGPADQIAVIIETGYANAADVPPGIRDILMRITAQLYEYREHVVPGVLEEAPGWLTHVMAGYWRPRC